MAQTTTDKKVDLYQKVTDRIIALLEKGTVPWKRTWSSYGMAKNYATGHQYTGINAILMNCTPYEVPYFLSFKQAKQLGGKVKKGAKSEQVIYFSIYYKDENNKTITREKAKALKAKGQDITVLKFIKYFNVFPIEQVEGIEYDLPEIKLSDNEKIERCEQVIKAMPSPPKIDVLSSSRAFYSPHKDLVQIPAINQFESSEEYYCTLCRVGTGRHTWVSPCGFPYPPHRTVRATFTAHGSPSVVCRSTVVVYFVVTIPAKCNEFFKNACFVPLDVMHLQILGATTFLTLEAIPQFHFKLAFYHVLWQGVPF